VLNLRDLKLSFDSKTLEGKSRLDALKYPISNIIAAYEARNAIFVKRGALGMIISRKTDESGSVPLLKKEKEQIQDSYQHNYGVTGDRNMIAISDVPVDFISFNVSLRDMEAFRETFEDAKTIASAYGIPPTLVPGNQSTAYDRAIETAEKSIYQNTVIPLTNNIIEALNTWLGLSRKWEKGGMYLEADFSGIPFLQEDKKFSAEVLRIKTDTAIKQYEKGFITYNQALVEMGKEEIPGSDYLVWDDKNRNKTQQNQEQNDTQNNQDKNNGR
jgi:phage portal protein BeeE